MTTGDNSSRTRCYATVPDRLVALLLDAVVLSVLAFVAALVVSVALGPAVELDGGAESVGDAVQTDRGVAVVDALRRRGTGRPVLRGIVAALRSHARPARPRAARRLGRTVPA